VRERYHLACLKDALKQPAIKALLTVLRGAQWQHQLGTLPGYESVASGEVQSLSALLPWWTFKDRKPAA